MGVPPRATATTNSYYTYYCYCTYYSYYKYYTSVPTTYMALGCQDISWGHTSVRTATFATTWHCAVRTFHGVINELLTIKTVIKMLKQYVTLTSLG